MMTVEVVLVKPDHELHAVLRRHSKAWPDESRATTAEAAAHRDGRLPPPESVRPGAK